MHNSGPFELKDTASEYSMDSAYQSQSGASRRGTRRPEDFHQDTQGAMNNQFIGSDLYSPSLGSDCYTSMPDHSLDMSQMHLPAAAGAWDASEYANYSAGQDYTHYPTSNQRYMQTPAVNISLQLGAADYQSQSNPYTYTTYPSNGMSFNAAAPSQRSWSQAHNDTSARVGLMRSTSSPTVHQGSRRQSAYDVNAFIASPVSTASMPLPQSAEYSQSPYLDARNDNQEITSAYFPARLDEEEGDVASPIETAEAKLEEERTKVARSHPLYQQGPDHEGKYHCPEAGKPGCNHKPTSLKCNYDKYVDSHLKPFRCNKKACADLQFSSTACLLRHEREAHGMHGHGSRPHLCHFVDCERAVQGHGFPRRYNLFDHMKRVHQYEGPTTEPSPLIKPVTQKRKRTSSEEGSTKRTKVAKVTKISAEQQLQQRREQMTQRFLTKKQHIIDILNKLAGPNDLGDDIQLTKEVVGLHDICTDFRESFGG